MDRSSERIVYAAAASPSFSRNIVRYSFSPIGKAAALHPNSEE